MGLFGWGHTFLMSSNLITLWPEHTLWVGWFEWHRHQPLFLGSIVSNFSLFSNNALNLKFFLPFSRWRAQSSERVGELAWGPTAGKSWSPIWTRVCAQSALHCTCHSPDARIYGRCWSTVVAPGETGCCPPRLQPQNLSSWHVPSALSQLGLSTPSGDAPEHHMHRPSLRHDSPAGLFLPRSVARTAEVPRDAWYPTSLGPLASPSCYCGISHIFILEALFLSFDLPE